MVLNVTDLLYIKIKFYHKALRIRHYFVIYNKTYSINKNTTIITNMSNMSHI